VSWHLRGHVKESQPPIAMPLPIWNALQGRGFLTKESIENLFFPSLKDMQDPFSLKDMEKVCQRLFHALKNREKIAIYADFDLDGSSGLALLYEGLRGLGFQDLIIYQPKRLTEGYGLHVHAVEELASLGVQVIISVDVGITALEAAQKARDLGIDLVITDHHLPYEALPEAYAIINPNQKECTSNLGYLCGAGVAFFLLMGLKKTLKYFGSESEFDLKNILDFFAIGTLTDMVPLISENRILTKHGLQRLSRTQRPALKALIDTLGFGSRNLTSQEVAIQIAPKLNALSRMETEYLPRDIFLETESKKAEGLVAHVLKTQEMRRSFQKNALEKAIFLKEELNQHGYIWVWSQNFHKGVIGLVATSLCGTYGVPVFVGTVTGDGEIVASARLPEESLLDLTQILEGGSSLLLRHGGHAQAAGFSLSIEKALLLDKYFAHYFRESVQGENSRNTFYDTLLKFTELTPSFMRWIESLEPFGKGFPYFEFLFQRVEVLKIRELKGGHLKFVLKQGQEVKDALIFSPGVMSRDIRVGDVVDIIGEPKWNYFNGTKTIQIMIKHFRQGLLS